MGADGPQIGACPLFGAGGLLLLLTTIRPGPLTFPLEEGSTSSPMASELLTIGGIARLSGLTVRWFSSTLASYVRHSSRRGPLRWSLACEATCAAWLPRCARGPSPVPE